MTAGYIYVLVNSSMPGLVKVGKTARSPSERAQELSSATGVATPFVIAFEHFFRDVDVAERQIHAELEQCGTRQAMNREFFRVSASDVVRVILVAASNEQHVKTTEITASATTFRARPPWAEIMEEADAYREGEGDSLQDVGEAIRLYKAAARMGSPEACRELGNIYRFGDGVAENHREALEWLKQAADRGLYACYIPIGWIFARHNQNENALKAFRRFFAVYGTRVEEGFVNDRHLDYEIERYVHICLDHSLPIEFPQYIGKARAEILARVEPRLEDQIFDSERRELTRVRDTLRATLPPTPPMGVESPAFPERGPRLIPE